MNCMDLLDVDFKGPAFTWRVHGMGFSFKNVLIEGFSIVISRRCDLILLQYMLQCWALTIAQSLLNGSQTFRRERRDFISRSFGQIRRYVGN